MWLPKDERLLLAGLYHNIGEADKQKWYHISDLARLLKKYAAQCIPEIDEAGPVKSDLPDDAGFCEQQHEIKTYIADSNRIRKATRQLALRNLIVEQTSNRIDVLGMSLTVAGCDLGLQYGKWLPRSGLWFREYKDHWLWLIVGFVGGGFVGGLINALFKLWTDNSPAK
jgi:hypothetical protein